MFDNQENAREVIESMFESSFGLSSDDDLLIVLKQIARGEDNIEVPSELMDEDAEEEDVENLFALVREMSIPQKIKLALFGNKMARSLLLRDPMKQIPLFVLQNGKLTDLELMEIVKNSNLDESVLRAVGVNSRWMKDYNMKLSLVSNPKAPLDVSLKWLKYIKDKDMRRLARSKNIPQVLASQCRRLTDQRKHQ